MVARAESDSIDRPERGPVGDASGTLIDQSLRDSTITSSPLPDQNKDLIVTPLVGFDAAGHRLGMGGGWYDRTLAFRRSAAAPPWLVGAGFSVQREDALAVEDWDVPLDAVCTETDTFLPHTPPA